MSNREVMQQALEALEAVYGDSCDAIHALRAALAEPTGKDHLQVEPVAWLIKWLNANDGAPQGEWQRGYDAARNVVRAHLKAAQLVANRQMTTEPVANRAFLEHVLAAIESVIDVADRKTDEFDALRSCAIDLTVLLHTERK